MDQQTTKQLDELKTDLKDLRLYVARAKQVNWGALGAVASALLTVVIYYGEIRDRAGTESDARQNLWLQRLSDRVHASAQEQHDHTNLGGHVGVEARIGSVDREISRLGSRIDRLEGRLLETKGGELGDLEEHD